MDEMTCRFCKCFVLSEQYCTKLSHFIKKLKPVCTDPSISQCKHSKTSWDFHGDKWCRLCGKHLEYDRKMMH